MTVDLTQLVSALMLLLVAGCVLYATISFFRVKFPEVAEGTLRYTPLEAIGITIAGYIVAQVAAALLFGAYFTITGSEVDSIGALANFSYIAIVSLLYGSIVVMFLRKRGVHLRKIGVNNARASHLAYAALAFVIYMPITGVVQTIASKYLAIDVAQPQELGFATNVVGVELLATFIALVIIPPLFEELVMRGFLYTGLRQKMNVITAAVITSVIFGVAHLQLGSGNPPLWVAAIDTFVLSMFLVYLREKTGSLWPAISLHAIKNFLAFTVLFVLKLPIS